MSDILVDDPVATVHLPEDGVLQFRYKRDAVIDADDARRVVEATADALAAHGPRPTIVWVGDVRKVTRGAREFFARDPLNNRTSSRVAMIGISAVGRVVANFFLGLNRPDNMPVRVFADEASARAWLGETS